MRIFYQLFTSLLTLAVIVCLPTSCKDDDSIFAEVELPGGASLSEVMTLEQWSYEIPFQVKSDSEWIIETTGDCCYATPEKGSGNATVQICVLDNDSEERVNGELRVIFPKDSSRNIILKVQQKSTADYDDNADILNTGNRIYAVGYGYDISGEYASPKSVTKPIIKYSSLIEDELIAFGPVAASFEAKTYSGSSVTELSNDLNVAADFGGSYFGFSGEIGASFSMKDFSSNNNEYAITYVEVALKNVQLETDVADLRENYMTPSAYRAINGVDAKGEPSSNYPSTKEGFKKLIENYGTHLIMNARLGGRMKYVMSVDLSKVEGAYDLDAFANASYKNSFVHASVSVSDTYKQSYQQNSAACSQSLQVLGGGTHEALELSGSDTDAKVSAWKQSLENGVNLALVGFDVKNSLISLYELVDEAKYPQRYAAFKAYMTGEEIAQDIKSVQMEYQCGTATHISSIPSFSDNSTLVKDVYISGQCVVRFCEEFIPVINKQKRVVVAYPVISNKVKLNMGYFIGDDSHKPAKVCWEGDKLTVTEYADELKGAKKELYVRGSAFSTASLDEKVNGQIVDYFVAAVGHEGSYNYPIVKIFNNFWMKENYRADRQEDGDYFGDQYNLIPCYSEYYDQSYYCDQMVFDKDFAPKGWRLPTQADFLSIQSTLLANDVRDISTAKAFYSDAKGGVLGFGLKNFSGCGSKDGTIFNTYNSCYICVKDNNYDGTIYLSDDEKFGIHYWDQTYDALWPSVRLIME